MGRRLLTSLRSGAVSTRAACAAIAAWAALATAAASANNSATAAASAHAAIVARATLVKADDLAFGSIIPGNSAGDVKIDEDSCARSGTGGVTLVGSSTHCAQFAGQATFGFLMTTSLDNTVTLAGDAGGTMTATLVLRGGEGTTLFPGTGVNLFWVGGTLHVGHYQTPGTYTGSFNLSVDYL